VLEAFGIELALAEIDDGLFFPPPVKAPAIPTSATG
jgi:hypothetical protein